ncbi:hypothetical protein MMC30_004465 [Trapelia coarctata]|nr:hypothetical protein [Trapelia coarctata]
MELLSGRTFLLAVASCVVYFITLAVYRLYFSPIAKFPGPKLAALTLWYEFYYDVVKRGQYIWKIKQLHEQYGPIIRINPYELHINDPDYYDEVYAGNSRRTNKWSWTAKQFGTTLSSVGTESHELHRIRRGALSNFFSKGSVQRLEPVVQSTIDKLVTRLEDRKGSNRAINVIDMFAAFTADVIGQYAFARPFGYLDHPDFAPFWHKLMMDSSEISLLRKQFGWVESVVGSMPVPLLQIVSPGMLASNNLKKKTSEGIEQVKEELERGHKPNGQTTIFLDILTNDGLRPQEKETNYLVDEAVTVVAAGTVTTAHTLSVITFHLLNNPEMLRKLQSELHTVMPDGQGQAKWQQLEQLPYLTAIISEGLRIGYGVTHRLQRVSPDVPLQFNEWTIPVNTPVGMSAPLLHDNPTIFPNPRAFNPERWIQPSNVRLQKYLVPFSRGTRQCTGMNLAYCEMYLTLAALFAPGRFSFDLFETDITDVETPHDFFNPCYRLDSKGIRVVVS